MRSSSCMAIRVTSLAFLHLAEALLRSSSPWLLRAPSSSTLRGNEQVLQDGRSTATGDAPPRLLVLARGQAFRDTPGKGAEDKQDGDPTEQELVIRSIAEHVLLALGKSGWSVDLAVDAVVNSDEQRELLQNLLEEETADAVGQLKTRVGFELGDTQVESLVMSMNWVSDVLDLSTYDALLILRNDLIFKIDIPLGIENLYKPRTILVPWQDCFQPLAVEGYRKLMDTFLFIPQQRLTEFVSALRERSMDTTGRSRYSLLWIDSLPDVEPLFTSFRAHASSKATPNPLYINAGREQSPDPLPSACLQVGECRSHEECCRPRPVSLSVFPGPLLCSCDSMGLLNASEAGIRCHHIKTREHGIPTMFWKAVGMSAVEPGPADEKWDREGLY